MGLDLSYSCVSGLHQRRRPQSICLRPSRKNEKAAGSVARGPAALKLSKNDQSKRAGAPGCTRTTPTLLKKHHSRT